jgi:tRNA-modifying protein YgfZ
MSLSINIILNPIAALRISGADANTYLQGQFSNDLTGSLGLVRYGLWLDHKGRVQADSDLLRIGENEWLCFSGSLPGPELAALLQRSIIADEVEVADETSRWNGAVLRGDGMEAKLAGLGLGMPTAERCVAQPDLIAFPARAPHPGAVRLVWDVDAAARIRSQLQPDSRETGLADFERERILQGLPSVPRDIGPTDLPQEGGLDRTAVSFTKGCFVGQEVMARLQSRGQVRRRLQVVRGTGTAPAYRSALYQGGKPVGEVRSTAPAGGGFVALAMLTLAGLDPARGLAAGGAAPEDISIVRHG